MNPLPLSVVIPTYERPESLDRLLRSVARQTLDPARFEVVVSLDGEQPAARAVAERAWPFVVRVASGPHGGRARACNRGLEAARGVIVALCDDDLELSPGCLLAHVDAHASTADLVVLGPVGFAPDPAGGPLRAHVGAIIDRHMERMARPGYSPGLRDFYTGNCSLPRRLMARVGMFDEDFALYGNEDRDLLVRLRDAGAKILFAADALAVQHWDKDARRVLRDAVGQGATSARLWDKHPSSRAESRLATHATSPVWVRALRRGGVGALRVVPGAVGLVERAAAAALSHRPGLLEAVRGVFFWHGAWSAGWRPPAGHPGPIVHFTDSEAFGGAEQALVRLAAAQRRAGRDVVVIHHGADELERALAREQVPHLVAPRMDEGLRAVPAMLRFARAVRARRPAVFHAHLSWPMACKWGLVAAALARTPVVAATSQLFVDVPVGPLRRAQIATLGRIVRPLIAVSQGTADNLVQRLGWPARNIVVVRNAIGPLPDDPARARRGRDRLAWTEGRVTALVPARLDAQKGHDTLVRAARDLPGVAFALAGDGDLAPTVRGWITEAGVSERVRMMGFQNAMDELMAACDLVVLPSLYEGLPLSLLEAMAAARPVVASDIPGTRELVVHGVTGILVPPDASDALARAIGTIASDPELAWRMGEAGRARVRAEFDVAAMERRVAEAYGWA